MGEERMYQSKHIKIAIKPHDCTGHQLCAVCGSQTEPQKPFDLFLDKTSQLVCKPCAVKYAPELVSLMDYFYKGHYVEPEYEEIEKEVETVKRISEKLRTDDLEQLQEDLIILSKKTYVLQKFIGDLTAEPVDS